MISIAQLAKVFHSDSDPPNLFGVRGVLPELEHLFCRCTSASALTTVPRVTENFAPPSYPSTPVSPSQ